MRKLTIMVIASALMKRQDRYQISRPMYLVIGLLVISGLVAHHLGWRLHYDLHAGKIVPVNIFAKLPRAPVSEAHVGWLAFCMVLSPLAQDQEFRHCLFAARYSDRRADNPWAGTVVAPLANAKFREVLADRLADSLLIRNQITQAEARQLVLDGCDFILNEIYPH